MTSEAIFNFACCTVPFRYQLAPTCCCCKTRWHSDNWFFFGHHLSTSKVTTTLRSDNCILSSGMRPFLSRFISPGKTSLMLICTRCLVPSHYSSSVTPDISGPYRLRKYVWSPDKEIEHEQATTSTTKYIYILIICFAKCSMRQANKVTWCYHPHLKANGWPDLKTTLPSQPFPIFCLFS